MKIKHPIQDVAKNLGLSKLRKFQNDAINSILDHQDTMVIAPAGPGRLAIHQIPAIISGNKGKWALVIEPTLALIVDQITNLRKVGIAAETMTGRNDKKHDIILEKLCNRELTVLYVTPEILQKPTFRFVIRDKPPWLLVVDEAHCVLDWGFTFRSDYLKIKNLYS